MNPSLANGKAFPVCVLGDDGIAGGGALDALVELFAQGGDGGFVGEGYRGFVVVPCEAGVIGPLDLDLKGDGCG